MKIPINKNFTEAISWPIQLQDFQKCLMPQQIEVVERDLVCVNFQYDELCRKNIN